MRLDGRVLHGRPYQDKDERFRRTLGVELLQGRPFADAMMLEGAFARWREMYNHEHPHESLAYATPASHYQPSVRAMPSTLRAVVCDAADAVRRVDRSGQLRFSPLNLRQIDVSLSPCPPRDSEKT